MVPQVSRSLQAEIHSSLKLFRLEQSWWTNRETSSRPLSVWLLRSFIRVIHSKITELTGITEKKLEGCPDFGTVWQDFCKFSEEDFSEGKREIIFWGNCDRAVLLSNLLYHGFEQEENLQLYDLQALFDRAVLKSSQQSALSTALTALKLTPYGQYHSALSDAVNAASILKALGGEDFVQKNLHKVVLRKRSGKTKSNEEGTLLLQKTFYGITDIASLKPEFEPELGSCLNAPFQEVLPGFYRNHKKIWAYRSRDQLIKVTSRSYPAPGRKRQGLCGQVLSDRPDPSGAAAAVEQQAKPVSEPPSGKRTQRKSAERCALNLK